MKTSEIIFLGGLAVFAGALLYGSFDMPYSTDTTIGPGFIPLNVSLGLLVLLLLSFSRKFLFAKKTSSNTEEEDNTSDTPAPLKAIVLVAIMAFIAICIFAMEYVGVLIPLGVLLAVLSWRFSGHSLIKSIIVSLVLLAVIYLIFSIWLQIPLH